MNCEAGRLSEDFWLSSAFLNRHHVYITIVTLTLKKQTALDSPFSILLSFFFNLYLTFKNQNLTKNYTSKITKSLPKALLEMQLGQFGGLFYVVKLCRCLLLISFLAACILVIFFASAFPFLEVIRSNWLKIVYTIFQKVKPPRTENVVNLSKWVRTSKVKIKGFRSWVLQQRLQALISTLGATWHYLTS